MIFFWANIFAGISALLASRLAARFGLIRTMVATHLPSNILLILVPLMPTPAAGGAGAAGAVQHQSDGRADEAVLPHGRRESRRSDRPPPGITGVARTIGAAISPLFVGFMFARPALINLPFFIAGTLKIAYDLLLYRAIRRHSPPRGDVAVSGRRRRRERGIDMPDEKNPPELQRAKAEGVREKQEDNRQEAEHGRGTAEGERASAEAARKEAEEFRRLAEEAREVRDHYREALESIREEREHLREVGETARSAGEEARTAAEAARHATMEAVSATAETLQATLENMKIVEDMRRTLRDIRDVNKLGPN